MLSQRLSAASSVLQNNPTHAADHRTETMQAGSLSQAAAVLRSSSITVGTLTLPLGRVMNTLSEVEQEAFHLAVSAKTPKQRLSVAPDSNGLFTYAIGATDYFSGSHLPAKFPEPLLVTCTLDPALNVSRLLMGDLNGRVYCDAHLETPHPAAASTSAEPSSAAPPAQRPMPQASQRPLLDAQARVRVATGSPPLATQAASPRQEPPTFFAHAAGLSLAMPKPVSLPAQTSLQAHDTAVVNREQGVKTPNGTHLRPEIKNQIADLHGQGKRPAQIAEQIPGLTAQQAKNALARISGTKDNNSVKRARELTGNSDATAADYQRVQNAKRAQELTGDPEATSADYQRMQDAKRAQKLTGDPEATSSDYRRMQNAKLAREFTGNSDATAADYHRMQKAKRAQELTGNPHAAAADYDRIRRKARREGLTFEQVVEAEKQNPTA
ncbi:hypothetical protein ACFQDN_23080 [Pseudomonas asuensis]